MLSDRRRSPGKFQSLLCAEAMAMAAGMAAASTMRHGIAAHTSSVAKLCGKAAEAGRARRVLQIETNIAANTPAATSAHIPIMTSRIRYALPFGSERRHSWTGRLGEGARRRGRDSERAAIDLLLTRQSVRIGTLGKICISIACPRTVRISAVRYKSSGSRLTTGTPLRLTSLSRTTSGFHNYPR
jgi:hypothetical protein